MRIKLLLFSLAILFCLAGCVVSNTHVDTQTKVSKDPEGQLEIIGDRLTSKQTDCIKNALSYLPDSFRKSVLTIHLRDDLSHFEYSYLGKTKLAVGHNCKAKGRKVCLRPEYLKYELIWHEVAHVYTHCNSNTDDFSYQWQKIAGDVYADDYEDYYKDDPSEGLLTNYSRRNYLEDIAEWVQCCYTYLYLDKNHWAFNNKHLKRDSRYRKKLALLYKYGFLTEGDYQKLKPLFE